MPRGLLKSKKLSGFQQRKVRKAREKTLTEYEGSMLRFVEVSGKSQQPDDEAGIFESDNTQDVF